MEQVTFDNIRNSGHLLYEYVRGSQAYGTSLPTSDTDTGGVYICEPDILYGLSQNYKEQISDAKSDNVWYELGRYISLLLVSNPNMLESLYIPDRCVLYEHPLITELKKNRDMFLTKDCFRSFIGYAIAQIQKARGLNKKCVNPILKRNTPIDYCYTFDGKQGAKPIAQWLEENGLKQKYCGLNHIPNMNQMHGLYYDWGEHLHLEFANKDEFMKYCNDNRFGNPFLFNLLRYNGVNINQHDIFHLEKLWDTLVPKGYHGIQKEDGSSDEVRLDSIIKGDVPLCHMSYNDDGYQSHCRQYREYKEWEQKRNPQRYLDNVNNGRGYDAKNVMHSVRLLHMGIEIATTGKFNVDRTGIDRDLLLDIRKGNYEYDDLIKMLEDEKTNLDEAIKTSTLPKTADREQINQLLIDLRKKFYNKK
jgi:hypothetical protein